MAQAHPLQHRAHALADVATAGAAQDQRQRRSRRSSGPSAAGGPGRPRPPRVGGGTSPPRTFSRLRSSNTTAPRLGRSSRWINEQGALARTGMAGDEQHLARRDLEADIDQRLVPPAYCLLTLSKRRTLMPRLCRSGATSWRRWRRSVVPAAGRQPCGCRPGHSKPPTSGRGFPLIGSADQLPASGGSCGRCGSGTNRRCRPPCAPAWPPPAPGSPGWRRCGVGLHALATLDRTAVATTTALARLALIHGTFRRALGAGRGGREPGRQRLQHLRPGQLQPALPRAACAGHANGARRCAHLRDARHGHRRAAPLRPPPRRSSSAARASRASRKIWPTLSFSSPSSPAAGAGRSGAAAASTVPVTGSDGIFCSM